MNRYLYKNYSKSDDEWALAEVMGHALSLAKISGGRVIFSTVYKNRFPDNELIKTEDMIGLGKGFFKDLMVRPNFLDDTEVTYTTAKELSSHLVGNKDVVILIHCPLVDLLEFEKKIKAHSLIYLAPHVQDHKGIDSYWEHLWNGNVTVMDE